MSLSHALGQHSVSRTKKFLTRTHNSAGPRTHPVNAGTLAPTKVGLDTSVVVTVAQKVRV